MKDRKFGPASKRTVVALVERGRRVSSRGESAPGSEVRAEAEATVGAFRVSYLARYLTVEYGPVNDTGRAAASERAFIGRLDQ
jgi:hypothetical protein